MIQYKINAKLDSSDNADESSVYDYFTTDILALHSTPQQAQEVAEVGYKGADADGVGCTWTIDEVIL